MDIEFAPIDEAAAGPSREELRVSLRVPCLEQVSHHLSLPEEYLGIRVDGQRAGYAVVVPDFFVPDLTPFACAIYLEPWAACRRSAVLDELVESDRVRGAVVRTDETGVLNELLERSFTHHVLAVLYRLSKPPGAELPEGCQVVEGHPDEWERVLPVYLEAPEVDPGTETADDVRHIVRDRPHYRLERGDQVLAVARCEELGHGHFGVGAIVPPSRRGLGLGRALVGAVVDRRVRAGQVFLALTDPEDRASRRLAESLGAEMVSLWMYFAFPGTGASVALRSL
jgi:GNAT superfamily N-acetyltransferase